MEALIQQLKLLIDDLPQLFQQLKSLLLPTSPAFNDIILQETRYREADTERLAGRLAFDQAGLVINQVRQSLLIIIDGLTTKDLRDAASASQGLNAYHSLTCDRRDQSEKFEELFKLNEAKKVHYFYLYGLDLQSHKGFYKRIAFDLEGRLQDHLNPGFSSGCKSIKIELTFDVSRNLEIYKQNILKNLFAALSVRTNEHDPLTQKSMAWLLDQSPVLKGLGANDFVCIFVAISQWDWDKTVTPAITKWFIEEFCGPGMPADSPSFLFFFGIIFEEEEGTVELEVEAFIAQSQTVNALPELGMVGMADIGQWFNKYSLIAPGARELRELRTKHFGNTNEHYMEDVERTLEELIEAYNSRF